MNFSLENSGNQRVILPTKYNLEIFIKREDKIHPIISGNKYRKLKYNLIDAKGKGHNTLLTFGGAYSNHIAAVAAAGNHFGFKTIGVIRGEELVDKIDENPTLKQASNHGMQFKFISREDYRNKNCEEFVEDLKVEFGQLYLLPEGGTNHLAVKGCEEILNSKDRDFDYICCPVGTGGTIAGLINCSQPRQQVLGFPALKGDFLNDNIIKFATKNNWKLITDYHFGGYAKINKELISFINGFKEKYNIPLDSIYTGKMMYGILDLIEKGFFTENSKILAIHTGGLQGIESINLRLMKKKLPLIE